MLLLFSVCRGLCDGLIFRPNESYQVSNKIKGITRVLGGQGPLKVCRATEEGKKKEGRKERREEGKAEGVDCSSNPVLLTFYFLEMPLPP
jgi:hypothetical protein